MKSILLHEMVISLNLFKLNNVPICSPTGNRKLMHEMTISYSWLFCSLVVCAIKKLCDIFVYIFTRQGVRRANTHRYLTDEQRSIVKIYTEICNFLVTQTTSLTAQLIWQLRQCGIIEKKLHQNDWL